MVHSLKTITSLQDGDYKSVTDRSIFEPDKFVPYVMDVATRKTD